MYMKWLLCFVCVCFVCGIGHQTQAQELEHDTKCLIVGSIASTCYIRGWAGKPVSYVDGYINGLVNTFKDRGVSLTDTDAEEFLNGCGTFFNVGRRDSMSGVGYQTAKANQYIINKQVPIEYCNR